MSGFKVSSKGGPPMPEPLCEPCQEPDPTGLSDSIRETLKASVLTRKKDQIYSEKLKMLKDQSQIVVSPTLQASIEKEK